METLELLQECKLQLEYLNEKFGQTGTTNSLLAKIDKKINQPRGYSKRELLLHRMSDWLMINTPLDVEEIVDFCEYFKTY
jgi:hypothetical protein